MQAPDDSVLLRQYVEGNSEEAFATLVRRHVDLVYSVALRRVQDVQLAEEVTQAVFIVLAKKARQLRHIHALSSWLFQTARLTSKNAVRSEARRRRREHEAQRQSTLNDSHGDIWLEINPLLDEAVDQLRERDRQAIVLRFYQGRSVQEIASLQGSSRDATEKRISRAVDKLRDFFGHHGISAGGVGLAVAISAKAVHAAPAALAATISTSVSASIGTAAAASHVAMRMLYRILGIAAMLTCIATYFAGHFNGAKEGSDNNPQHVPLPSNQIHRLQSSNAMNVARAEDRASEDRQALGRAAGGKIKDAILLSTAMTRYVVQNKSSVPTSFDQITSFLRNEPPLSGTSDFEILPSVSYEELKQLQRMSVAIIRERQVWLTASGKKARVYGMLGGVAEIVETEDNFQAWEARHVFSPGDDD